MHTHVEGKGLGLYLVKTQVETLKGKIDVESELGKGATFKVYFPIE
jgi:signal transduction histidine kinase